jgi:pimeloyl-ACP methyl ester carboxylesterase
MSGSGCEGAVTADYSSRVSALAVTRRGSGPCVVLVHGSVTDGELTWRAQAPLAERYTLLIVDRPGFGDAPPPDGRVDWETDAGLVAEALPEGAHLVGHSYGGVIALLAAARRPEVLASLTVVEPPAFAVARGDPEVERFVAEAGAHWQEGPDDPEAFLRRFLELVSPSSPPLQSPVGARLIAGARLLRRERLPFEAAIPVEALRRAAIPTLAISGGHHPAFEVVCDVLARDLAAVRAVVRGAGHAVPRVGPAFNEVLERFLRRR